MARAALLAVALTALLLPAAAPAATARWERLDPGRGGPGKRSDAALAAPGSRTAYLHGGERTGRPLGDLWRLDVKRGRWTRLEPKGARPAPRFGHDLVAARDGTLLLFGGQAGADFFGDTWRYDPKRNSWSRIETSGPAPRYGAGVAYDRAGGRLYVTHGFTNDGRFDDTWTLTGGAFADSSAPAGERPLERCLVGAAFHGGGLFIFGGQSNPLPFRDDLWRYDAAARRWSELSPAGRPSARNTYGSAQLGPTWLIHGGSTRRGIVGDLWAIDLRNPAAFTRVRARGRTPGTRANHAMASLGATRALIQGGSADGGAERGDTWLLRIED